MSLKKWITAILLLFIVTAAVSAQSLYNNEYYQKSVELRQKADTAYSDGYYDDAYEYALEAEKYAKMSDDYIIQMKLMYQANSMLKTALRRIEYADRINLIGFNAPLYQEARDSYDSAANLFELKSYEDSIIQSEKVIALLGEIKPQLVVIPPSIVQLLPKFYTVRLIPERRDCFWRIAEYEFVYADGTKWRVLYDQNKKQIVDANNPDLIHPGQVFEIPSIKGEERDGMFDPEIEYPSINETK